MTDPVDPQAPAPESFAGLLRHNIEALRREREREDSRASLEERIAGHITHFTGSMRFVYLHLVLLIAWVSINLGWIPQVPVFDPTFVILAMVASVEAIFLSTFILISQNRALASDQKRADLNLQMSLLTEHEVTKLVKVLAAIGRKLGVEEAFDPSLEPLTHDVEPEEVLEELEEK